MRTVIIAAKSDNHVIGQNDDLPWSMPADEAFFKGVTPVELGDLPSLGDEVTEQLASKPVALGIGSVFMGLLALTPLPAAR